ncbi:hypothetical protein ATN89_17250 [Comamonas thiooxydans]|nr:hypothetical protein ATN89_17250 [Comamonas thiooxydans]
MICKICNAPVHSIALHLKNDHKGADGKPVMTIQEYQEKYPGEEIYSAYAKQAMAQHLAEKERKAAIEAADATKSFAEKTKSELTESGDELGVSGDPRTGGVFHEVFVLGDTPAARSSTTGAPIPVTVLNLPKNGSVRFIPELNEHYVFNVDVLKTLSLGIELNIPSYLWGHAGTGKSTIWEQICARTQRPMIRVQHTANMEEEHVVGGWRLRDGKTIFELGMLPLAMKNGWLYLADEYDFARPEVLSLYQAVLEGKPLIIKEADPENRVIFPHPNFRFAATGNTNGQGDETGLYQGTVVQNAANYERFGIVEHMPYMDEGQEATVVAAAAKCNLVDAKKLVSFATAIRKEFDSARLSNPISPRSLIAAARIGIARGSLKIGLEKAYMNRLSSVDRTAAMQFADRIFA